MMIRKTVLACVAALGLALAASAENAEAFNGFGGFRGGGFSGFNCDRNFDGIPDRFQSFRSRGGFGGHFGGGLQQRITPFYGGVDIDVFDRRGRQLIDLDVFERRGFPQRRCIPIGALRGRF